MLSAHGAAVVVVGVGLVVVGVAGFAVSLYFTLVTYRVMRPDPRWLPAVCRMDDATCARVVDTPYARVLGMPNSVYGLAWFSALAVVGAAVALGWTPDPLPCLLLLGASIGTVALSAYLTWSLVVALRTGCVLCFVSHGLNVAALGLLLAVCAPWG